MRTKHYAAGALALAACAVGLRFAAQWALRVDESTATTTRPCGPLTFRTMTVTRRGRFDQRAEVIRSESTIVRDEQILASGIEEFHCGMSFQSRHLVFAAAVVEAARRTELKLIGGLPEFDRVVSFEHPITGIAWSNGAKLVAVAGKTEVSIFDTERSAAPVVVSRGRTIARGSTSWAPDDAKLCWLTEESTVSGERAFELWCRSGTAAPTSLARASSSDPAGAWVGFERGVPHLCGDELKPRDITCRGIPRAP